MSRSRRVGVVGAGIVGLAVARRVLEVDPGADVTVLDKERRVAAHQTGHNSGVVHAGIYYRPGSLKAELTRRGRAALLELCEARRVPVEVCGKLVVALDERELSPLGEIERRSRASGVTVHRLTQQQIGAVEPHAAGIAGLHCPSTAIVDYRRVAEALAAEITERGGRLLLGAAVTALHQTNAGPSASVRVSSTGGDLELDRAVLCAGLQSDRVAALAGAAADPAIVPFRGEYYRLADHAAGLVRALLYPVPDARYPFLGVHFTRRIDGRVEVGPNAVLALSREGYRWGQLDRRDLAALAGYPGFRRLALRHWRTALREVAGSLSTRLYLQQARRYLPELAPGELVRAGAGVRAQAVGLDGCLLDDFAIERLGSVVAVRNAPSPAATASLAIAERVVDLALAD